MIVSMEVASDKYCCGNVATFCVVEGCMAWNFATPEDINRNKIAYTFDTETLALVKDVIKRIEEMQGLLCTPDGLSAKEQKTLSGLRNQLDNLYLSSEQKLEAWEPPAPERPSNCRFVDKFVADDGELYGICVARWEYDKKPSDRMGFCGLAHIQK